MDLKILGWNEVFENEFRAAASTGMSAGRVATENKQRYIVYTEAGELTAELTGRLLYSSDNPSDLPKVGDWVLVNIFEEERKALIHGVLPRKTAFSRKSAGIKTEEQVIAANIDYIFIVQGLDNDYNLRRLERYVVMTEESGAQPVIILNKCDLIDDVEEKIIQAKKVAPDISIHAISASKRKNIHEVQQYIIPGKTIVFAGSSGAGKSTLINVIAGDTLQKTGTVREDDSRGRHTTTNRELFILPGGGILIDTPGMRELQLWSSNDGLEKTFPEIEYYAVNCRFSNCTHMQETGCAVREAIEDNLISEDRFASFSKLKKEQYYLKTKQDKHAYLNEKKRVKDMHKEWKQRKKTAPKTKR